MHTCRRFLISGRVQGVFFRDSTRNRAMQLGLTGHAINLPDGRVEVLACGSEAALEKLDGWLHEGPAHARVDAVESTDDDGPSPTAFTTG